MTPIGAAALREALAQLLRPAETLADVGEAGTRPPGAQTSPTPSRDQVVVSDSVRALTAILERMAAAPAAAAASKPVLAAPPTDASAFAETLKTTFAQSGLFYESHQAQWVAGERPLEELLKEPQATLKAADEPLHRDAIPLVRQQLEALNTGQLVWQGQVWPGQPLEWRIEEDRNGGETREGAEPVWKTSLRLVLPRLGEVRATIALQGQDVRVAFAGLEADTHSQVKAQQPGLREALERSGLALVEVSLDRHAT